MNMNNSLDLEFPDWSDHPPPPRASNDEYIAWVTDTLRWLPQLTAEEAADPSAPGPANVPFRL
jgi:hypothetical protein